MHVDGFRFDEGSILSRLQDGTPSAFAPVLWNIELSEPLMDTKLIAEAWDAAGLYQIGSFPGFRWAEWNAREPGTGSLGEPGTGGAWDGPTIFHFSGTVLRFSSPHRLFPEALDKVPLLIKSTDVVKNAPSLAKSCGPRHAYTRGVWLISDCRSISHRSSLASERS